MAAPLKYTHKQNSAKFCYILALEFCIFLLTASSSKSKLPLLDGYAINSIVQHSCLVVHSESTRDEIKTLVLNVRDKFKLPQRGENQVVFGRIDSIEKTQNDVLYKSIEASRVLLKEVFVFPKLVPDRVCLLPAPRADESKPDVYTGEIDIETLLEFVNGNCNTFRDISGSISTAGLHRNHIVDNLFSVKSFSPASMMKIFTTAIHPLNSSHYYIPAESISQTGNKCDSNDPLGEDCSTFNKVNPSTKYSKENNKESNERIVIPRCDLVFGSTTVDFFSDYLSKSRPLVIKGITKKWPAFVKWTQDFLNKTYGTKKVHIKLAPLGEFEGVENINQWEDSKTFKIPEQVQSKLYHPDTVVVRPASVSVLFSEFINMISNSSYLNKNVSAYLEYTSLSEYFAELSEDIGKVPFIDHIGLKLRHLNIWLSNGNTLGKLHFDQFDNFLCQLSGWKEVILFEPHSNEELYEAHIQEAMLKYNSKNQTFRRKGLMDSTSRVMSPVDIKRPDFKKFPLLKNAAPINCTIDEGDILYIPAFWWHEVQSYPSIDDHRNLALNFWYEPFLTKEFPCPECKLDVNPEYYHLLQ